MSSDSGEKTEAPTPKKLAESRKEGQVARTPDLGAWLGILAATLIVPGLLGAMMNRAASLLNRAVKLVAEPDAALALTLLREAAADGAAVVAPLVLTLPAIAVFAGIVQGGLHLATKNLKIQPKRLNPAKGVKRAFGPQGAWEGVKAVIKTAVLGSVLWYVLNTAVPALIASGALTLSASIESVASSGLALMRAAAVTGLVVAALDYAVIKRRTNKSLRMSHAEIKQENRQSEGDPMLKGAIRAKQLAVSRNRMMSDIAGANAVIVNPTHVAVALRYDPAKGAPRVVAKGSGVVAARIRAKAAEHNVPLIQDVALARALHAACELGQEIPAELYTAVARVLAFVLRLRAATSSAGDPDTVHRVPEPIAVPSGQHPVLPGALRE
jgi:flagellar biosynthetic protein FlhB